MINKLDNFPPIHFISVDYSLERRKRLYKKFLKYDIKNLTAHIYKKYSLHDYKIVSDNIETLSNDNLAAVTSHLRTIKSWYYGTDEPYAFFCEDDLSLETVEYWNFTWEEFFNRLPEDWECVQLCWLRNNFYAFNVEFRTRCWCDWSACAYLIKRNYAKKLIDHYYYNDTFNLNLVAEDYSFRPFWAINPCSETIIFSPIDTVIYTAPLFVEDIRFSPSYKIPEKQTKTNDLEDHVNSYVECMNWWKNVGKNTSLSEFMGSH